MKTEISTCRECDSMLKKLDENNYCFECAAHLREAGEYAEMPVEVEKYGELIGVADGYYLKVGGVRHDLLGFITYNRPGSEPGETHVKPVIVWDKPDELFIYSSMDDRPEAGKEII